MSDEKPSPASEAPETAEAGGKPSDSPRAASQDLADGLELMLRAARKVVKKVDPAKLESASRRAIDSLESLDAKKVGDFGKKAAKNLDPKKIEEVAGEAGRELLSVIERVADRMEKIVDRAMHEDGGSAASPKQNAQPSAAPDATADAAPASSTPPRVRIDDG